MNFPTIHGIIVTDEHNHICDAEGTIVTRHTDEQTRKLDLRVLMNFISEMNDSSSLFVVGYNTWKNMGGMFRGQIGDRNVIVSHEDHCTYLDEKVMYENDVTLFNYCAELALRRKSPSIAVLGGRSVYNTFYRNYSSVIHCQVKIGNVIKDGKKVLVKPHTIITSNDKYLLNNVRIGCYRPIDNESYSVSIYSHSFGE